MSQLYPSQPQHLVYHVRGLGIDSHVMHGWRVVAVQAFFLQAGSHMVEKHKPFSLLPYLRLRRRSQKGARRSQRSQRPALFSCMPKCCGAELRRGISGILRHTTRGPQRRTYIMKAGFVNPWSSRRSEFQCSLP